MKKLKDVSVDVTGWMYKKEGKDEKWTLKEHERVLRQIKTTAGIDRFAAKGSYSDNILVEVVRGAKAG